ncbi:hypothetical protein BJX65DRAFT_318499 [Aspergillus insuetus]
MRFISALVPRALPLLLLVTPVLTLNTDPSSHYVIISLILPGKIALSSSTDDVATIVGTLAKLPQAVFAIRSGGHSPNPGWANAALGITIGLQQLNNVHVSCDGCIASVGSGTRWVDVHRVLDSLELEVIGGKFGSVGVGGLILGGGISAFSPSRGWACDNVVNFQVVLASALKGGQNNFGVVTRFDLQTFRHGLYWGGNLAYPDTTEEAHFMYASPPNGSASRSCPNPMFYAEPVVKPNGLRPFSDIQPQLFSTMLLANCDTSVIFRFTPEILPRIELTRMANLTFVLTFMDIPAQPPNSRNSFGFPSDSHPDRELFLDLFSLHWLDASYSSMIPAEARILIRDIEDLVADVGLAHPFLYANWVTWWQDPIRGYGEDSVRQLQRMSREYDPDRVFQESVPGGFKLPRDGV